MNTGQDINEPLNMINKKWDDLVNESVAIEPEIFELAEELTEGVTVNDEDCIWDGLLVFGRKEPE